MPMLYKCYAIIEYQVGL